MAGIDVVIPAGGTLDADFSRVVDTSSKALIKFNEVSILQSTIDALRASRQIGRIAVVGSPDVLASEEVKLADLAVPAVGSSPDNIEAGAMALSQLDFPPDRIVIVTCDLPFLTGETVDSFIDLCTDQTDFYVPLINKVDFEERFPGAEATFVRLHDGEWTTGCMYIASLRGLKVAKPHLEKLFQNRKSKVKMAMTLGPKFVWDYFQRKLTVDSIEKKVMDLLNVRGSAVPGAPPELAFDVDYLEDYHYVVSLLKARALPEEPEAEAAPAP